MINQNSFVKWFSEITISDVPTVGGKNASLGEMYQDLVPKGVRVPNGFAITADAYRAFLKENNLDSIIADDLKGLNTKDIKNLREKGQKIRHAIIEATLPLELKDAITTAYHQLCEGRKDSPDVAVRSSATAEDLPDASFAGQQDTFLNVRGDTALLESCKRCFASLFTDRAISYRVDKGFADAKIALSIGVQLMVRSDLATSGVMFSIDTETGFKDNVLINASYGLGENIVQGSVNPDEFLVFKPTLKKGFRPILKKTLGSKEFKLVYDLDGSKMTKNIPVAPSDRVNFSLTDDEILTLAKWACQIEDHYSQKLEHLSPMDMEWAKDGVTGELFIVQARPETVQSQKFKTKKNVLEVYTLKEKGPSILQGHSVGEKISQGIVRVIENVHDLAQLKSGEVLVTDKTDPDWEPAMKRAAAIITNRGGRTCHAAIVSRELGVPAVVGTENGTQVLKTGQPVTVSCAESEVGFIYEGLLNFNITKTDLKNLGKPKTKIMMNVANPDEAFRLSFIPNDGVGLARMEFIISTFIKIHPLALVHYDQITEHKKEIDQLTLSYKDKPQYFVDKLAQGIAMIAAAFFPKDVIVRMSDFKTNEYANLLGGKQYEPVEANPMLGFRGASRYYDKRYREGFALECRAIKKVREEMGLTNVKLMIPFCRTLEEAKLVFTEMEMNGIKRGVNKLEVYVMCEVPSNVILADEFSQYFDGFSIGSNDLTQLALGVDRDSEIVAHDFDERDPAVKKLIEMVIKSAKANHKKIGICGQAPSDYPEFAQFLVKQGIDSISLNPDAVIKTTLKVLESEQTPESEGDHHIHFIHTPNSKNDILKNRSTVQ